jgi:polar amino acid transport system substrate-binding protein
MNDRPSKASSHWTGILAVFLSVIAIALATIAWRSPATIGSNSSSAAAGGGTLTRALRDQKVRVGVVPYAPIVVIDPATKRPSGHAVDVMDAIGKAGGFAVEYEVVDWSTMNAALASGKIDAVVSSIFKNPVRAKEFTFTAPTMYFGLSGIVRANDSTVQTAADLTKPGLKVAVLAGEAGQEYVKRFMPKAEVTVLTGSDLTIPMMEVVSGRAQLAFGDLATTRRFVSNNKAVRDVFANDPLNVSAAGFMVRRDDPAWVDFLNAGIENLLLSGELDRLEEQYNKDGIWIPVKKPWK